jgi:sodium-coupled neutral amino acid transporter 11
MVVIVCTILVQGIMTPASERGSFSPSLLLFNGGFFQAIGVISFGMSLNLYP